MFGIDIRLLVPADPVQPSDLGVRPRTSADPEKRQRTRVAIVGTGFVGSTTAYALLMTGTAAEIVLVDRDRRRAEAHAHDLRDAAVFLHRTGAFSGDFADCCSADVTIMAVGVSQTSIKSRFLEFIVGIGYLMELMGDVPEGIDVPAWGRSSLLSSTWSG